MYDEIQTIVIDTGSMNTKAGFAGEESPRCFIPTCCGRNLNPKPFIEKDIYYGDSAVANPTLQRSYPIKRGIITNFDDIEGFWRDTFYNELRCEPSEHPVLLTEVPMNPKANREKITEIMFEKFNVPSFYLANQAILSLYSSGCTTGIVFESGAEASSIVPIKDSKDITQAEDSFDFAGKDLTDWCQKILPKSVMPVNTVTPDLFENYYEKIKLDISYVALDYESELEKAKSTS